MENSDVANIFSHIADLLEISGDNPFRIRSYRNGARIIEGLPLRLGTIVERDDTALEEIPGIGKGLHEKIVEILKTGKCGFYEELLKKHPSTLLDLLAIPGLGPKKVRYLYENKGIETMDALEKAAREGKLSGLPGMGEKTETNILKSIESVRKRSGRSHISTAMARAEALVNYLREIPGVTKAVYAGSLRRWKDTIGDIDILVTCADASSVMTRFVSHPEVERVIAKGETKSSALFGNQMQVDVRVVDENAFGAALQYFTGSKEHNVALRLRSKKRGLKISEYGVFRESDGSQVAGKEEKDVYKAVGLPCIVPQLREGRGEIEAAEKGNLPDLIDANHIKGDLHMHTTWSDGRDSIEDMARAAMKRGYEYIAITDHSRAVGIAHGLDEERLLRQIEEIDRINDENRKKGSAFTILRGSELDIRADGSLDLDHSVLKKLDIVIGAIHSGFTMSEEEMTKRIIRALSTGLINIIAHPTGRLINRREPYAVNMEKVFHAAREHGTAMEINSHPYRLDLNDIHCRQAIEAGLSLAISTDSHNGEQMENIIYGVNTARRGWIEASSVINTKSIGELRKFLKKD